MTLEGKDSGRPVDSTRQSLRGSDLCICHTYKKSRLCKDLGYAALAGGSPNFPISNTVVFPPIYPEPHDSGVLFKPLTSGQVKRIRARVYVHQ